MTRLIGLRAARARRLMIGVWCVSLLLVAVELRGETAEPERENSLLSRLTDRFGRSLVARCLSPAVGTAMSEVVASGALKPVLGSELTLEKGSVRSNEIELEIQDRGGIHYLVTLALPGTRDGEPAARGVRFWTYLAEAQSPNPRTREALLALARIFDAAIPETALSTCGGTNASPEDQREDKRYPRVVALASAVIEALIVLVAIAYGVRALRVRADEPR